MHVRHLPLIGQSAGPFSRQDLNFIITLSVDGPAYNRYQAISGHSAHYKSRDDSLNVFDS